MKKIIFLHFTYVMLALFFIGLTTSCEKENLSNCEVVANANGPAFLKVTNTSGQEIFVDMTDVIPLGAHVRHRACEIYGLPVGNHTITVENEAGTKSKDVEISLEQEEEYVISVTANFF